MAHRGDERTKSALNGLSRLQHQMVEDHIDALMLGGSAAGAFAGGHVRIGVHMPGWPLPTTVVPHVGSPHVVTADPDGAVHLGEAFVHGIVWSRALMAESLRSWLAHIPVGVIGVDALSPAGIQLVKDAFPSAELVDATVSLARAMMPKTLEEMQFLRVSCELVNQAIRAGLDRGAIAMVECLKGAFPALPPYLGLSSARVAAVVNGFIGDARWGKGDRDALSAAIDMIQVGRSFDRLATDLPSGIEVVGLGRGYEPPVLREGRASPSGLCVMATSVLSVRSRSASVTIEASAQGPHLLSPSPKEVVLE
ncbi:MAG: hypothetical protein M1115_00135 [Actinobacteria bacterium]|nr:hypothetical protein [Actinomycetota bacterium]